LPFPKYLRNILGIMGKYDKKKEAYREI
jgi:hypothetical protein